MILNLKRRDLIPSLYLQSGEKFRRPSFLYYLYGIEEIMVYVIVAGKSIFHLDMIKYDARGDRLTMTIAQHNGKNKESQ